MPHYRTFFGQTQKEARARMIMSTIGHEVNIIAVKEIKPFLGFIGRQGYEINVCVYDDYEKKSMQLGRIATPSEVMRDAYPEINKLASVAPHLAQKLVKAKSGTMSESVSPTHTKTISMDTPTENDGVVVDVKPVKEVKSKNIGLIQAAENARKLLTRLATGAQQDDAVKDEEKSNNTLSEEPEPPINSASPEVSAIMQELRSLREDFTKLTHPDEEGHQDKMDTEQYWTPYGKLGTMIKILKSNEVDYQIISDIGNRVKEEMIPKDLESENAVRTKVHSTVKELFKASGAIKLKKQHRRVIILVGPPGAGKTTTLGKLGAEYQLKRQKSVRFITIDTYRLAASEQLKSFANIINVPCDVVVSPSELKNVLAKAKEEIIFIDTTGRPQKDTLRLNEIKAFIDTVDDEGLEVHLVVSATTKMRDLESVLACYRAVRYNRIIFTKLDETETYGNIINALHRFKVPISYLCHGQEVPKDIKVATKDYLADLILEDRSYV